MLNKKNSLFNSYVMLYSLINERCFRGTKANKNNRTQS